MEHEVFVVSNDFLFHSLGHSASDKSQLKVSN